MRNKQMKIFNKDKINTEYLKTLAMDNVIYSKTLISRGQAVSHEEAKEIFIKSNLGLVFETKKGYKLVLLND